LIKQQNKNIYFSEGFVLVQICTRWLNRGPHNVADEDIAVESWGQAITEPFLFISTGCG